MKTPTIVLKEDDIIIDDFGIYTAIDLSEKFKTMILTLNGVEYHTGSSIPVPLYHVDTLKPPYEEGWIRLEVRDHKDRPLLNGFYKVLG